MTSSESKPLVSIILPTYNVEEYLEKCLKSIMVQTYKEIEVIIVIDGSTDKSYDIALAWEQKDNRIKVIYQENAGSGPARNTGLTHAIGEFCMFVDPDDWIDNQMVEKLIEYQKMGNYDLVLSKCRTVTSNGAIINEDKKTGIISASNRVETRGQYLKLLGMEYLGAPTKKLFRMDIINNKKIEFPDMRRSQDIVFNYRYYNEIESVLAVDDIYYNYFIDEKIYTSKLKSDYYKTLSFIFHEISHYCMTWGVPLCGEDYSSACNYLFHSVMANMEACILRNEKIDKIVLDENIIELISGSCPERLDEKIVKTLALNKQYRIMSMVILEKYYLKRIRVSIKSSYTGRKRQKNG